MMIVAAACLLGLGLPQDGPVRKDATLRAQLEELEGRLHVLETGLRREAKLPGVDGSIIGEGAQPDVMGRIVEAFDDGVSALMTLELLPWDDRKAPVYLDADTGRRFIDLSRREKSDLKGFVLYGWLKAGSEDRLDRVVIGREEPYRAWEKKHAVAIDALRAEIAQVLEKKRAEAEEGLYKEAAVRKRESDLQKEEYARRRQRALRIKSLKEGGRGPNGWVRAKDPEKRTLTLAFWRDGRQSERTWPVAKEGVVIFFQRREEADFARLGIGARIHTWFSGPDQAEIVVIESYGAHVGGFHGAPALLDREKRTITVPPSKSVKHPGTYAVDDRTDIGIEGREATFEDLDPSKPVRLRLLSDMKTVISVQQGRKPK